MMSAMIILYVTIWLAAKAGERIAMTPIDTKMFFIIILTVWILLKNIT